MPRIRTIKPEFFTDPDMGECSPMARLLAIGLLTYADCAGRMEWNPAMFAGVLFPHDEQTASDIDGLADELGAIGYLLRWEAPRKANGKRGKRYGVIVNFNRHQRMSGSEASATSRLPAPPDGAADNAVGAYVEILSASAGSGEEADRHAGKEGKGKERKDPPTPHGGLFGPVEVKATRKPRTRRSKTHPDAPALFAHFKAEFAATQGKPTSKTLGTFAKAAGPRLEEHGLDACKAVASWAMRSPHSRAKHLRSEGFLSGETLWRPSKFEGYLDLARADVGPSGSVRAVYATFLDWLNDPAHKAARTERVCAMVDEAEVSTVWDYDAMIDKMARWTAETTVPDELRAEARAYFARWKGE